MYNVPDIIFEDELSDSTRELFYAKINYSFAVANLTLFASPRSHELVNNIIEIKINGNNIMRLDMFEYLIIDDNLKNGEFAVIVTIDDNNFWIARKTYTDKIEYFNFTPEDRTSTVDLLAIFTRDYKQRITL